MTKRILALVLTFVMVLGMVPAFAANANDTCAVPGCEGKYARQEGTFKLGADDTDGCVLVCNKNDEHLSDGYTHEEDYLIEKLKGNLDASVAQWVDLAYEKLDGQHKVVCGKCNYASTPVPCDFTNGVCKCGYVCPHTSHGIDGACSVCDVTGLHSYNAQGICSCSLHVAIEDASGRTRCYATTHTNGTETCQLEEDHPSYATMHAVMCKDCGAIIQNSGVTCTFSDTAVSVGDGTHTYACTDEACHNKDVANCSDYLVDCVGGTYGHYAKCSECGYLTNGHTPTWVLDEATGVVECKYCALTNEEMTACAHTNVEAITTGFAPVCKPVDNTEKNPAADFTAGETASYKCKDCGAITQEAEPIVLTSHNWGKEVVLEKPTCANDGTAEVVCKDCDKVWTYAIPHENNADAHGELKFVRHLEAPKCGVEGEDLYECQLCHEDVVLEVKALSHKNASIVYGLLVDDAELDDIDAEGEDTVWTRDASKFDCTMGIYTFTGCTNCWYEYDEKGEIKEGSIKYCDVAADGTTPKITKEAQHEYNKFVSYVAETCTQYAGTKYQCSNAYCGQTVIKDEDGNIITGVGAKTSHKGEIITEEIVAGDCTTAREYMYICADCNAQVEKVDGKYVTTTKTFKDAIPGHTNAKDTLNQAQYKNQGDWIYVKPTCESEGYWKSYCSRCEGNYTEIKGENKAAHKYSVTTYIGEVTCGKAAKATKSCEWCGKVEKENGEVKIYPIAAANVKCEWAILGTPVKAPTCNEGGEGWIYCTRCGTEKYVVGTDAMKATGKHVYEYSYKPATCTSKAKLGWFCIYCGKADGTPANVEGSTALGACDFVATGKTFEACGHKKALFEYECKNCGELKYLDSYNNNYYTLDQLDAEHAALFGEKVLQKKTCTQDGFSKDKYCKVCGYFGQDSKTVWYPAGHVGEKGAAVTYCTGTYYDYKCTVCKKDILEVVSSAIDQTKPHGADNEWVKYDTTNGKEPGCLTEGYGVKYCPECGWTDDGPKPIAPKHTMTGKRVIVDATCSEGGKYIEYCAVCGLEGAIKDIEATDKCEFVKYVKYSNSCEYNNYVVYECKHCGGRMDLDDLKELGYSEYIDAFYFKYVDEYGEIQEELLDTAVEELDNNFTGHAFGESTYREATCTQPEGYRYNCVICGFEAVDSKRTPNPGDANGHDYIFSLVAPTCYTKGAITATCYECGYTVKETLEIDPENNEKIAHRHYVASYDLEGVDASETEVFGYVETFTNALKIDKNDPRTVKPTCSTKGYNVWKCSECGYEEIEELGYDKNNHEWVTVVEHTAPTCTKTGLALQKCAKCNVTPEIRVLEAKHQWDAGVVTVPATCTEEGEKLYTCTVAGCGKTKTEILTQTKHNIVTIEREADCTHDAGIVTKCADCDFEFDFVRTGAKALKHIWSSKTFVPATCTTKGGFEWHCLREGCTKSYFKAENIYPELNHPNKTFVKKVEATCIKAAYNVYNCPLCGIVEIPVTGGKVDKVNGHDWKITNDYGQNITCENPGYVDMKCELCNATKTKVQHTPACKKTDYIYTDDAIYRFCKVCGKVTDKDVLWVSESFTGFSGCISIKWVGDKKIMTGAHKDLYVVEGYEATCEAPGMSDHIECKACGEIVKIGVAIPKHEVQEVAAVAATCTKDGSTAGKYCIVCEKYVVEPQVIKSEGHKAVAIPDVAPTVSAPGSKGGMKCEVCQEVLVQPEVLPQLSGMIDRLCTLRKLAADYRDNPESTVIAMLDTTDVITITGELVNEYYPVSSAYGDGFIHMNYLKVA